MPVFTDPKHFLYHNTVMIIDGTTVLTGSFNFKADAEESNAENLLRLNSPKLRQAVPHGLGKTPPTFRSGKTEEHAEIKIHLQSFMTKNT